MNKILIAWIIISSACTPFCEAKEQEDIAGVEFYDRVNLPVVSNKYGAPRCPLMLVQCKEISRRETDLQRNWHGDEEPTTIVILYRIEEIFVGANNLLGSKVGSMIKKDGDLYLLDITTSTVLPKQPAEFIGVIRNWTSGIETLDLHLAGINFPVYAPHCNPKNHNPTLSEK